MVFLHMHSMLCNIPGGQKAAVQPTTPAPQKLHEEFILSHISDKAHILYNKHTHHVLHPSPAGKESPSSYVTPLCTQTSGYRDGGVKEIYAVAFCDTAHRNQE